MAPAAVLVEPVVVALEAAVAAGIAGIVAEPAGQPGEFAVIVDTGNIAGIAAPQAAGLAAHSRELVAG